MRMPMPTQRYISFGNQTPFVKAVLPFAAGIFLFDRFPFFIPVLFYLLPILALIFGFFSFYITKIPTTVSNIFLIFSFLLLGYWVAFQHDHRSCKNWFGHALKREISNPTNHSTKYILEVQATPVRKPKTWKVPVRVVAKMNQQNLENQRGIANIYIKTSDSIPLKQGDQIIVGNNWQPIPKNGNPFSFDYSTFSRRQYLFYQQFISNDDWLQLHVSERVGIIATVHSYCLHQLANHLKDSSVLGLMQ